MSDFAPGYLGVITINNEDLSQVCNVFNWEGQANEIPRKTFGNPWGHYIAGQLEGTFSADGFVEAGTYADVWDLFVNKGPYAASLQLGEASGATDAGLITGQALIIAHSITSAVEGGVDFTIRGRFTGTVSHTPGGSS